MGENYFGLTDAGKQRNNNEDSFIAQTAFKKKRILACVIDGVGGYDGGEIAAQLTRDTIIQSLEKKTAGEVIPEMVASLELANKRIFTEKETSRKNEKMACVVTLVIVDLEKNELSYAHVGDTRLYLFRDSSLVKITRDHSAVGFLEETGRISEAAAMQHPKRNEVNKALGYESDLPISADFFDTGESPFLPDDIILLCSDGLTDMVASSTIIEILKSGNNLKTCAQQLIDAANAAGGKDNITVVLVKNDKVPVKHEVTKPVLPIKNDSTSQSEDSSDFVTLANIDRADKKDKADNKKGNGLRNFLILLCIIFFSGFAWYFYKSLDIPETPKVVMPPTIKVVATNGFNLNDSIAGVLQNNTFSISSGQAVTVADSIFINKDSLHIIGNGSVLSADSMYKGAAFILSSTCKYVLLDSLTLSGFDIAIMVQNKGLHLKNVRFQNCDVPVQFQYQLPQNTFITGTQSDNIFNQQDSLHK
ncbi:hypothetical protein BH11BAC3_BH11BAC3_30190 [soil metagenome]